VKHKVFQEFLYSGQWFPACAALSALSGSFCFFPGLTPRADLLDPFGVFRKTETAEKNVQTLHFDRKAAGALDFPLARFQRSQSFP
jgi:hypothetical protein